MHRHYWAVPDRYYEPSSIDTVVMLALDRCKRLDVMVAF